MKRQLDYIALARYVGNALSIIGYFVLLHIDPLLGSCIKIVGLSLVTPFCIKLKLWDVVFVFGFFGVLDASNVFKLLTN